MQVREARLIQPRHLVMMREGAALGRQAADAVVKHLRTNVGDVAQASHRHLVDQAFEDRLRLLGLPQAMSCGGWRREGARAGPAAPSR